MQKKKCPQIEIKPNLNHKGLDDPVESKPVVVASSRMRAEILDRFGAFLSEQMNSDVAHRSVQNCEFGQFLILNIGLKFAFLLKLIFIHILIRHT